MFWSPPSRPAVNTIFSSTLTWTLPIWAAGVVGVFTADVSFAFALMTSTQRERIGANSTKYLQQFYKSSIGFPAHWNSSQYNVMVICCSTWAFRTTILVKSNGTLGLFWQFHHSSPLPPYNVGSVCSKCPPWSNIVWVGGGRAKFGKKSCFYHRTGGDNENIANFQGVPYTFDQDWYCEVSKALDTSEGTECAFTLQYKVSTLYISRAHPTSTHNWNWNFPLTCPLWAKFINKGINIFAFAS